MTYRPANFTIAKKMNNHSATITRQYNQFQTEGDFELRNGMGEVIFKCKTLELKNDSNKRGVSCIPEGTYNVIKTKSPSQGVCFSVKDVPNRSHILIHKGNYAGSINPKTGIPDIKGCILVGTSLTDISADGIKDIVNSRNTMEKLLSLTEGFTLTIK